jgi:RND family efflux transporter MFP subunit
VSEALRRKTLSIYPNLALHKDYQKPLNCGMAFSRRKSSAGQLFQILLSFSMNQTTFSATKQLTLAMKIMGGVILSMSLIACSKKPTDEAEKTSSTPSATATPASTSATTEGKSPAVANPGNPATNAVAAPAPVVTVVTTKVEKKDLPVVLKAVGTAVSLASVDIRPQVTSAVAKVHFKEGQFVNKGEPLFSLDSRNDEANLAKANAQLAKDQAALADAKRQLARSRELVAQNFVSGAAADTAQTAVDSAAAVVAADLASVQTAQVALSYDTILAPHSGRAGVINTPAGSIVQANVTIMATLVQVNPIAVAFNLPQRDLADFLAAVSNQNNVKVTATLPEEKKPLIGKLQFVDNAVDTASGTVKLKAIFDNKDSKLWPGLFVNVGLTTKKLENVIVVPQSAIIQTVRGPIVYAVEDGKAVVKPVKMVFSAGPEAVVSGVEENDLIVTDGKQNLRPGVKVVEKPKDPPGAVKPGDAKAGDVKPTAAGTPAPSAPSSSPK